MSEKLKRLDDSRIEVPVSYLDTMKSSGIIYVSAALEENLEADAITQIANVASLPGIVGGVLAMPDVHTGYGFPIGGVAAFDLQDGVISPGGVGYDINCGVRLLGTGLMRHEMAGVMKELVGKIYTEVPSGVGSKGRIKLTVDDEKRVLRKGALWAVEEGFGEAADLERIESRGYLEGAEPMVVSKKAYERGKGQQGTLGSGNHFIEVQYVEKVYDEERASVFGLFKDQVTVMIHTGSRGFGHQVCTDFLSIIEKAYKKYGLNITDRELACVPFKSEEGQDYFAAMKAAANYAWANRQCIMHWVKNAFAQVFKVPVSSLDFNLVYDIAHNIAKVETHMVDGKPMELIVHRKGATRAYPPGHMELPEIYRSVGQPVLIPGDMGRASYVLVGTKKAMDETFGSTCHGAGRVLSRHQAIKKAKGRAIWRELEDKGIAVMSAGKKTLAEEMSEAYKDVESVVDVVERAGISTKVAKLRPLGVIKG
ncbi:MAG: RtcB family protein [Candidatus Magnetoovum sp. WYHC-5]|nr:RtcB family protein [Candidatus Magnetoovum sp. WYHC-5]